MTGTQWRTTHGAKRFKKYQYDVVCPECAIELEEEARECAKEDYKDD